MQFKLTEEQQMIRQAARDFAQNDLKPGVIERDEGMVYPTEQVKKMAELGFLGMMVSPEFARTFLSPVLDPMNDIPVADGAVLIILAVFFLRSFFRGALREIFSLLSIAAGYVAAVFFGPAFESSLHIWTNGSSLS